MEFELQKKELVERLERVGYIKDTAIKSAMLKVKRELFVPKEYFTEAYTDTPLPIPGNATISAPHMHAISLSSLKLNPGEKVLEVGAGSGILLAYIKEIVGEKGKVFGIEIEKATYEYGKNCLQKASYWKKVKYVLGDGSQGLKQYAPFDKILVSAGCPKLPKPIKDQVKVGGIIAAVIGSPQGRQDFIYFEKISESKFKTKNLGGVIFVPLRGKFGWK